MVLAGAVVLAGCGGGDAGLADGPIPTVPDATPPPVPELTVPDAEGTAQGATPPASPLPPPATPATPSEAPPEAASTAPAQPPSPQVPEDPEVFGRQVGIAGVRDAVSANADQVGSRGPDLVTELGRVLDAPDRRRIDQARRRIERWAAQGDLDDEVAVAALAALDEARAEAPEGRGEGREGEDDDDDTDDDD